MGMQSSLPSSASLSFFQGLSMVFSLSHSVSVGRWTPTWLYKGHQVATAHQQLLSGFLVLAISFNTERSLCGDRKTSALILVELEELDKSRETC